MTIQEAISEVDALVENDYRSSIKVRWLSDLDRYVRHEITDTHDGAPKEAFTGYDDGTAMSTVLLVPEPYSDVYRFYLEMHIYLANGEMGKYNNAKILYDNKYLTYVDYYNRCHMPIQKAYLKF